MIHQDDFKNYKHRLLSFNAFKIERTCAVYLFLSSLIYCSGQSQIYQRENNSIYITKETTFTSKSNIADSSASVNIYIADGTTIIGLQENTKSKILVTYLKCKYPKKSLKLVKTKRSNVIITPKIEESKPRITIKNNSGNEKFILLKNHFLTAVAPTNSNCDKLLGVLKSNTVQFATDFGGKTVAHQNSTSTQIRSISNFHSIRPPPYFLNSHNRVLSSKKCYDT
ncbi:MAG: hypothetical protein E2600_04790 [Chryseobacterium sp.]|nr:hypothetical protein [Chryseobacterium sp.]